MHTMHEDNFAPKKLPRKISFCPLKCKISRSYRNMNDTRRRKVRLSPRNSSESTGESGKVTGDNYLNLRVKQYVSFLIPAISLNEIWKKIEFAATRWG
jgi:hypothetical protein